MKKILFLLFFTIATSFAYAQSFTLDQIYATPFVADLVASSKTSDIVISVNNKGARNLYLLNAPSYQPKQITNFNADEGQEISSLQLSDDGVWAVFARGGDHSANSPARPIVPNSSISKGKIAIYSVNLKTSAVKLLDNGDFPVIHPNAKQVTYISEGQLKTAVLDGSTKPQSLFHDKGLPRAFKYSPDGKKLVFASRRDTHSFIGIYEEGNSFIKWLSPSFNKDDYPVWSPDGKKIAFVRQDGIGLGKDSTGIKSNSKWQLWVYDFATNQAEEIYRSSTNVRVAAPRTLQWSTPTSISYLSYEDGWPQLYAINPVNKSVKQLTKGKFAVDNVSYSADGSTIAFCANYGTAKEDVDVKQLGLVDVNKGSFKFVTSGKQIFSSLVFINGDKTIALLSSTATQPVLPTLVETTGKQEAKVLAKTLLPNFNYDNLVTPEHIRYDAPDGLEVYGQLFKPKNIKGKVPAIVYIHGGPRRQMYLGWNHLDYYFNDYAFNQYLASQGYVVLSINYRSGTGYGYSFQNAPRTSKNGIAEYQDILAGGQWLAQQDFVNADKIGVYGGSHGGYLTAMALAKNSDIFKVGVDVHGVHMRIKEADEPSSLGKSQLTALHSSPSFWVDGWKSPVLLIHADDDQNVAFEHSIDLYNRLKKRNVPVETMIVPNDTHHWMVFEHLLNMKKATFEFLNRHLK